jgi:hypothetical protein
LKYRNLQVLSLKGIDGKNLSGSGITHFSNLKQLSINSFEALNNEQLQLIAVNNPELKALSLKNCFDIQKPNADISCFKNLAHLSLGSSYSISENAFVSALKENQASLEHLHLFDCEFINERTFATITGPLISLKELVITACPGITDRTMVAIIRISPNLKQLILDGCPRVTQVAI